VFPFGPAAAAVFAAESDADPQLDFELSQLGRGAITGIRPRLGPSAYAAELSPEVGEVPPVPTGSLGTSGGDQRWGDDAILGPP
jgi:hypothetical protein